MAVYKKPAAPKKPASKSAAKPTAKAKPGVKVNISSVRSWDSDVARKSKKSPVISSHQRDLAKISSISAERRGYAKGMGPDEVGARNLGGKAFDRTMKSFKNTPVKKKSK